MSKIKESNINCPKCGADLSLSEVVAHTLNEKLAADFDARLEKERSRITAKAEESAETKLGTRLKDLESQVEEREARLREATAKELDMLKEKRVLEESRVNLELEVARKVDAERQGIASRAREEANEAGRLKIGEKDQHINDLQKKINELQQRAEQGSVQRQGETLETQLEDELRESYSSDEIREIKKGTRGADVLQVVRGKNGMECGGILWEAKRTKNWSNAWVTKLKDDQRKSGAELAVLVTTCLPEGARGIIEYRGVWVCEPSCALAIAGALRQGLIRTALQRAQETGRNDKAVILYDYVCGVEFRQNIEGIVEAFLAMKEQLDSEQRVFGRQWKKREEELKKILRHTAGLYGSIEGITGPEALPEIQLLQLPEGGK
jgi:hypothetical protein